LPGAACTTGETCSGNLADPTNCVYDCTCDATGHYACTMYADLPTCPAAPPACGDPCNPSPVVFCKCTTEGGTSPCTCDQATSQWSCTWPGGFCGLFGTAPAGTSCAEFPAGMGCGDTCECIAGCGTQIWTCGL
jgi:hypothetical protein